MNLVVGRVENELDELYDLKDDSDTLNDSSEVLCMLN